MADPGVTCWTLIEGAASGEEKARAEFVRRYASVAKAYLAKRWSGLPLSEEIEDALQEVFLECFREQGAIQRADPRRPGGFRAFYFGVIRNVARRYEKEQRRRSATKNPDVDPASLPAREEELDRALDRAWAEALIRQAGDRLRRSARSRGPEAEERAALLRLRFYEDKPIREIARLWGKEAAVLHHQYAVARREFKAALTEVVADHCDETPGEAHRECERLLALFS